MRSKAEVIRDELKDHKVLDIGGCGYGEDNPYEQELREAWAVSAKRSTLDLSDQSDLTVNLNQLPLPAFPADEHWDITTAFDVLEHLEHPVDVLRWVPTTRLLVSLPNALSPINRHLEEQQGEHLYSFTRFTATVLLDRGGWHVENSFYVMGKWSMTAKILNTIGSLWPSRVAPGIMFICRRKDQAVS